MLMSELAARAGVPVPTVKYYLREKVLMPGRATSATRAEYDETHIRRIALIKALSALGVSMTRIKVIVGLIDTADGPLLELIAAATWALPPVTEAAPDSGASTGNPRAASILATLGLTLPTEAPPVAQLEQALADAEAAGMPITDERFRIYTEHVTAIAAYEIENMPLDSASAAIEYSVLGTILYEPIIAALRRIAHAELSFRRLTAEAD
ncbi:MerR-like DNA binding protein [Nocardia puris]|uniref:MerR-like DNA binding protein n=2 Tax=Nocardia puris TaxID=208602 RepID=A0A366DWD8_9NOCA|nr:MerR-like DNA binding protein [Nocardia puris]